MDGKSEGKPPQAHSQRTDSKSEGKPPAGTLTAHGEGHRQQVWLLKALVFHSARDLDAVRLAHRHQGVSADDGDGAGPRSRLLSISGLSTQG